MNVELPQIVSVNAQSGRRSAAKGRMMIYYRHAHRLEQRPATPLGKCPSGPPESIQLSRQALSQDHCLSKTHLLSCECAALRNYSSDFLKLPRTTGPGVLHRLLQGS